MFLTAIDAPKHGNFVRIEQLQENDLLIREYPDFLEMPAFPHMNRRGY